MSETPVRDTIIGVVVFVILVLLGCLTTRRLGPPPTTGSTTPSASQDLELSDAQVRQLMREYGASEGDVRFVLRAVNDMNR